MFRPGSGSKTTFARDSCRSSLRGAACLCSVRPKARSAMTQAMALQDSQVAPEIALACRRNMSAGRMGVRETMLVVFGEACMKDGGSERECEGG